MTNSSKHKVQSNIISLYKKHSKFQSECGALKAMQQILKINNS